MDLLRPFFNDPRPRVQLWRRVLALWALMMAAETVLGTLRVLVVAPWLGELPAKQLGVIVGSAAILSIACLGWPWLRAASGRLQLRIGLVWVCLTLAFELALGWMLHTPASVLLSDYDLLHGGWLGLGLLVMAVSPLLAAHLRRA